MICPDAEIKIYVTADDQTRAGRRHKELVERGRDITLAQVLTALRDRDARDSARAAAPLKPAEDALLLDTSEMTVDQAVARAIALIEARQ